jgi:hypothetical protein
MRSTTIFSALTLTAMALTQASGAAVNFGNLTVYNNPLTIIPFNAPAGGPYTKFVCTTHWSFGTGGATSYAANWNIGNPVNAIIASLTSISGMANNGNTTMITVAGTLSVPVTNANALQLIAAQNSNNIGQFATSAFWSNATLNFYVQKPFITPAGVEYMGNLPSNPAHLVTIDTGGSTFDPTVALFSGDGFLLGTNESGGTGLPGTGLVDVTLATGDYWVFVAGAGTTFGAEDLDVTVPPEAPGGDLGGGVGGIPWPTTAIAPGEGQWFGFTVVPPACVGDINGDGDTNASDFVILAGNFGASVFPFTDGDLNGDGLVNAGDFVILAGDFGCAPFHR